MAKLTIDELIDAFKELTLIELSEFVKKFEEVFEVTAAAPVAVAAAPAALVLHDAGFAEAKKIEGIGSKLAPQHLDRVAPQRPRAEPPVQQQHRSPASVGFIVDDAWVRHK